MVLGKPGAEQLQIWLGEEKTFLLALHNLSNKRGAWQASGHSCKARSASRAACPLPRQAPYWSRAVAVKGCSDLWPAHIYLGQSSGLTLRRKAQQNILVQASGREKAFFNLFLKIS